MEHHIRADILPTYYQVGYPFLKNGILVGENVELASEPISVLHYHHCLEFGICISGHGETHVENRIYEFSPGDIQYVGPNIPHLSTAYEGEKCVWTWIFVDAMQLFLDVGNNSVNSFWKLTESGYSGVFHPGEHPELTAILYKFLDNWKEDDEFCALQNSFITGTCLVEAARIGDIDKRVKAAIPPRLKPALHYIREHYMDPQQMSAEKIAASCKLSISHFRALFKQHIGMTLPQYINKTRLSSAVYLLQNTKKSITEIAEESGFTEISYFNRAFRREYDMSPKEIRRKNAANKAQEKNQNQ